MFESRSVEGFPAASPALPEQATVPPELGGQHYLAVAREVAELVGGVCVVHLIDQAGRRLEPSAWCQAGGAARPWLRAAATSMRAQEGEGLLGGVAAAGKPRREAALTLEEARALPCDSSALAPLAPSGKLSLLAAPLYDAGEVVGTCTAIKAHDGRPYTDEDLVLVQALAKRVAQVRRMHEGRRARQEERDGLFRATFEQGAVGVVQVAPDGRILRANEAFCRIAGYAEEELAGIKMHALSSPDSSEAVGAAFERFLAGEAEACTRERRIVRKSGSAVDVREAASWVRDEAGRPAYAVVFVQAISGRESSEEALKESEKRLALMLQQTPAIIWSTDEELRLTRLMGAGLRARRAGEGPGVPAALVHARAPEALPFEVPRELQRRALRGESVPFEIEADGRVYQSRIEPFRDADGVKGVVGVATDVTERRRMHDALIESEERYRSFVATISEAIWCWELDAPLPVNLSVALQVRHIYQNARMVECNAVYAREIAGKPLGEVVGQRIRDLFELLPERFQFLSDFIRTGYRIQNKRYSDADARGKRRHYVANVVGIQENDRLVRIWGSRIDATETVDMERQVLNALEQQQQRIGHDLHDSVGQLLTAVRMLSEQLADDLGAQGAGEAALAEKIALFAQDALQQTRRVYRGLAPVMLQTEGLLTTLRDLAHNLDTLPDVACTFTTNTEAEVADPDAWIHMYRIMQEAAHNAIKHGRCKRLGLSLTSMKNKIVLAVRDDGDGFDPADVQGGGLGLSGMRYRAGLIGAVLEIESQPGQGTTLTCTVPPEGARVLEA